MLKIAVCVKQVPAEKKLVSNRDGNLDREGMAGCVNMYDYAAVETALKLRDAAGGVVDAFTMGPIQAEQTLREMLALGADRGILISDKAFSGADVLATSYTLSCAIQCMDTYDLILCGQKTTDGDTGQVGGELAVHMNNSYIAGVVGVEYVSDQYLKIVFETDEKKYEVMAAMPIVLTVDPRLSTVRIPSLADRLRSKKKEIINYGLDDFQIDKMRVGKSGSATKVVKLLSKEENQEKNICVMDAFEAIDFIENRKDLWIKSF
nr:electron transfer flavoprotein subunit beta/FixA family protein [uncultured Merdimonas sp.]